MDIKIPLDVTPQNRKTYESNLRLITQETGRLMLFAGDQKVEHLNEDFYGEGISAEDNDPEHMFRIASRGRIGAFATQLGFLAHYGMDYPKVPYIVKLNSKTNLVKTSQKDPLSNRWLGLTEVVEFRKTSRLNIAGVGYTVYLGSEHESEMLEEAARIVYHAHLNGLVAILWMYPRGKAVTDEKNPHLIAGATGIGAALGADYVKVNYPKAEHPAESLKEAVAAAGRTKVICAGGSKEDVPTFLSTLHDQIHIAGTSGSATGRNIHQRPLDEAVRFCNAISAITFDKKSVEEALRIYQG
jgi:fructose-bisphosphate aldolase/6-deoxy-5-ketofructose 1-phosphate synthase